MGGSDAQKMTSRCSITRQSRERGQASCRLTAASARRSQALMVTRTAPSQDQPEVEGVGQKGNAEGLRGTEEGRPRSFGLCDARAPPCPNHSRTNKPLPARNQVQHRSVTSSHEGALMMMMRTCLGTLGQQVCHRLVPYNQLRSRSHAHPHPSSRCSRLSRRRCSRQRRQRLRPSASGLARRLLRPRRRARAHRLRSRARYTLLTGRLGRRRRVG